jgi:methylenetetrahydrofolate reductase (NADPH)
MTLSELLSPADLAGRLATREAVMRLAQGFSLEATVRAPNAAAECARWLAPGSAVYISMLPGQSYHQSVTLAVQLKKAGLKPVPHVTARSLASPAAAADFFARLHGEAGIDHVLLLGGDRAQQAGPYASATALLESGIPALQGMRRIDVAGYPDGHPDIAAQQLQQALEAKIALARAQGLAIGVLSQFSFRPDRINAWATCLRAAHPDLPLAIGIAGPANAAALIKFALRCGVEASAAMLGKQPGSVLRLLAEAGPEPVLQAVAQHAAQPAGANIARCHYFSFGGIERTARWAGAVAQGRFDLSGPQQRMVVGIT